MDRDMVNCLHYIYQGVPFTPEELNGYDQSRMLFWCGPDTGKPLETREILDKSRPGEPVAMSQGVNDLIDMVEDQLRTMPKPDYAFAYPISNAIRKLGATRPSFLAIPYAQEFDAVNLAVQEVAKDTGFECEVTGDLSSPGDIMDQVWQGIRGADVVVADITGENPNVYYEIGLAHALGKEVILISQTADSPFDIRSSRRITYDASDLCYLKQQLADAFKAVSPRYPHEGNVEPRF